MPSTYTSLHYHVIFATTGRRPLIRDVWRSDLHDYLGGTVRGLGGAPEQVGGVDDHVHLLFALKPTHCLADFMRELKKASGVWVRDTHQARQFAWQQGYSAFSVSLSVIPKIRAYIQNQAQHHRKQSFQQEMAILVERLGLQLDPRFGD